MIFVLYTCTSVSVVGPESKFQTAEKCCKVMLIYYLGFTQIDDSGCLYQTTFVFDTSTTAVLCLCDPATLRQPSLDTIHTPRYLIEQRWKPNTRSKIKSKHKIKFRRKVCYWVFTWNFDCPITRNTLIWYHPINTPVGPLLAFLTTSQLVNLISKMLFWSDIYKVDDNDVLCTVVAAWGSHQ